MVNRMRPFSESLVRGAYSANADTVTSSQALQIVHCIASDTIECESTEGNDYLSKRMRMKHLAYENDLGVVVI